MLKISLLDDAPPLADLRKGALRVRIVGPSDEKCCECCAPYVGRVFPADHPEIQAFIDGPGLHPHCRHTAEPVLPERDDEPGDTEAAPREVVGKLLGADAGLEAVQDYLRGKRRELLDTGAIDFEELYNPDGTFRTLDELLRAVAEKAANEQLLRSVEIREKSPIDSEAGPARSVTPEKIVTIGPFILDVRDGPKEEESGSREGSEGGGYELIEVSLDPWTRYRLGKEAAWKEQIGPWHDQWLKFIRTQDVKYAGPSLTYIKNFVPQAEQLRDYGLWMRLYAAAEEKERARLERAGQRSVQDPLARLEGAGVGIAKAVVVDVVYSALELIAHTAGKQINAIVANLQRPFTSDIYIPFESSEKYYEEFGQALSSAKHAVATALYATAYTLSGNPKYADSFEDWKTLREIYDESLEGLANLPERDQAEIIARLVSNLELLLVSGPKGTGVARIDKSASLGKVRAFLDKEVGKIHIPEAGKLEKNNTLPQANKNQPAVKKPPAQRVWTQVEKKKWFKSLEKQEVQKNTPAFQYQVKNCGKWEYVIEGGRETFCSDGVELGSLEVILESKFVELPERSPYILDSSMPANIREMILQQPNDELRRIRKIIDDDANPIKRLRIITNEKRAVEFWESMMRKHGIPGEVVISK